MEVKREEEKRSDLQLQYTRDRCSWELEKAELKRRIAQLEAREGARLVKGVVQTAASLGTGVSPSPQKYQDDTLRREREEQRRLLADTQSTAMDLRCRLEHNERDWLREKAELLERFDVERREWEGQLKDMQKKIEELYCEVRAKREGTDTDSRKHYGDNEEHRHSIRSTSTGSSVLSDNSHSEPLSSSSQSEPSRPPLFTGFGSETRQSTGFQADSPSEFYVGGHFTQNDHIQPVGEDEMRSSGTWQQNSATQRREALDRADLDSSLQLHRSAEPHRTAAKENESVHQNPRDNPFWTELNYGSEKKKNSTALNAALKEIARVSEELCSYQDEIRQKSGDRRNQFDTDEKDVPLHHSNSRPELVEAPCDLSQIYDELRALERDNWITLSPDDTWRNNIGPGASWKSSTTHPESHKDPQVSPGILSEMDSTVPPIPPRTSSWNLSSPSHQDTELYIPESPMATARKCHSPCIVVARKCNSPSIVRKFEAMLQENEGKVLVDGVVTSCAAPANSNCNVSCCHNRWSCDASKFSSKVSTYGTVQKSFSEVNIVTAARNMGSDYSPGVANLQSQEVHQMPQTVREAPVDLHLSSPEIPPASPNLQGSRRNIMLEKKTAEFNRCLFQAEMGRGAKEQDTFSPTDPSPAVCQQMLLATVASGEGVLPRDVQLKQQCSDVSTCIIGVDPEITHSFSASDITKQSLEAQAQTMCGSRGQEIRMEPESHDPPSEQIHATLWEQTTKPSQRPECHSEVKHSPSRKTQIKATTEVLSSERFMYANMDPNVEASSSKTERDRGEKPQPIRTSVSLQQPSAENKQQPTTQPGQQVQPKHVSAQLDSSRQGLRIMNDHPWKPLTLAAYPRPEGSRSNYGAVERILKNYETAAKNLNRQKEPASSPNLSVGQESDKYMDMLDMDSVPIPLFIRETLPSHPTQMQRSSHKVLELQELTVQKNQVSSVSSALKQKNFSRPARPANRRLPSRWASRSPFSRSSPSSTALALPSFSLQKHSSSFTYSHAFRMESVII